MIKEKYNHEKARKKEQRGFQSALRSRQMFAVKASFVANLWLRPQGQFLALFKS